MIAMREAGYSIEYIANKAGLNKSTVGCRFRRWGVKPEFPVETISRVPESLYEDIRRMYWDEELTIDEIAESMGKTAGTVRFHMIRGGVPRRTMSEHQKLAWKRGRQPQVPRGFILNRLNEVENKNNEQNENNESADSVHN